MSKTETRSSTNQAKLFPTRTQSLRFPPLQRSNTNQPTASIPPSRLTLTSIPESRLSITRLTLSRLTTAVAGKRGTNLRRSETVIKNPDEKIVFQSMSKKDQEKLQPIANAYSLPVPKIKVLILNSKHTEAPNKQQQQQQFYANDFDPPTRENTLTNDLKVVGSRIEPLKSAKSRSYMTRPDSAIHSNNSDYTTIEFAKTKNDLNRNSLVINE